MPVDDDSRSPSQMPAGSEQNQGTPLYSELKKAGHHPTIEARKAQTHTGNTDAGHLEHHAPVAVNVSHKDGGHL